MLGLKGFATKPNLLEVCAHWHRSRAMSVSPRIHKNEAESVTVFLVLMSARLKTFLFLLTLECENFSAFSFIIYLFGAGISSLNSILHLPKYEKGEGLCVLRRILDVKVRWLLFVPVWLDPKMLCFF